MSIHTYVKQHVIIFPHISASTHTRACT